MRVLQALADEAHDATFDWLRLVAPGCAWLRPVDVSYLALYYLGI